MAQVLVRGLEESVIEKLRLRAERNHRSLEGELRDILSVASRQVDVETARRLIDEIRGRLSNRQHGDSAGLIREDRDR